MQSCNLCDLLLHIITKLSDNTDCLAGIFMLVCETWRQKCRVPLLSAAVAASGQCYPAQHPPLDPLRMIQGSDCNRINRACLLLLHPPLTTVQPSVEVLFITTYREAFPGVCSPIRLPILIGLHPNLNSHDYDELCSVRSSMDEGINRAHSSPVTGWAGRSKGRKERLHDLSLLPA